MKTIIAPSLLSADFSKLSTELKKFETCDDIWIHLDVMDGHFVPNLTFGATVLKNIQHHTKHKLDAHFMVTDPQNYIEPFKSVGLHNFTFHYEAVENPFSFIQELQKNFPSVGITIKPNTPIEVLTDEILTSIDLVLVMSVEPGFGGQGFIPGSENKIAWLKKKREELKTTYLIQVDGGINEKTAITAVESGADILVAGSYIFKQPNYPQAVNELRS